MAQNNTLVCGETREKLASFFDAGTFVELSAYTKRRTAPEEYEGVICGYGAINGKLVFTFAQDSSRSKGAFGERQAKKICELYSLAIKNGAPVIGIFDSHGAVVYDGAAALSAYARLMKCVSAASGIIPQIALIDGICAGSSAVIASMFDFTVTIKDKSKLYVNSPFVVGDELRESDFATKNGTSAYCAESDTDATDFIKKLVDILPSNNCEGAFSGDVADNLNRKIDLDASNYVTDELITKLADNGSFLKLYASYTNQLSAGLATFGGITACILASNGEGVLDIKSARVAARLVSFCDSFNIPVINLVDSIGLDISLEAEYDAYSSELARLATVYASSTNAKISVVIGKAYGASFALLGSKALGADMAYALEGAVISVLSPEASIAFVLNDKVGEKSREELEAEWKEKLASADEACGLGEIDDVIEPSELRQRICAALSMLAYKAENTPVRKHSNLPL